MHKIGKLVIRLIEIETENSGIIETLKLPLIVFISCGGKHLQTIP